MAERRIEEEFYQFDEEFRDTIATVDKSGKRIWIYPKKPKGRYHTLRSILAIVLLGLLFGGPFIKIGGHPLFLFNIFERKFVIFGAPFWPQDFILFALGFITMVIFVILFTVAFGRLWCGWACPQTIFMEMVFRKIEYWIEGDANQQWKLNHDPWNAEKVFKKSLKHLIFLAISIAISHTIMAYLIGAEGVVEVVSKPPSHNWAGFAGLAGFTGVFYWVFAYFREQVCVAVCPYGRLQGVLLIKDSMVVAYDWLRGEPRGKISKGEIKEGKGDCIDCKLCVHACPTGIDIRNGTQLECVNCTACMDACDDVMTRVNRPKGLIRMDSHNGIASGKKFGLNPRLAGYSAVLAILLGILVFLLVTRADVEATILRVPGTTYFEQEAGFVSNLYNVQFVNKTFDQMDLRINIFGIEGARVRLVGAQDIVVKPSEQIDGVLFIDLPREYLSESQTHVTLELYHGDNLVDKISTNFFGPVIINR